MRHTFRYKAYPILALISILVVVMFVTYRIVAQTNANPLISVPGGVVELGRVAVNTTTSRQIAVKNTTGTSLRIASILTSCGCTTADTLDKLGPGETRSFTIRFNSKNKNGKVEESVFISAVDNDDKPLVIHISGTVVETFISDPATITLGTLSTNEVRSVEASVTRVDGMLLHVQDILSPHVNRWRTSTLSPTKLKIVGRFLSGNLPGEYTEDVVVHTKAPLTAEFKVPIHYTILAQFHVHPNQVNLGVIPFNSSQSAVLQVFGLGADALALKTCPQNVTVVLEPHSPQQCVLRLTYVAKLSHGSFTTNNIVLTTHNPKQPMIIIPFFVGVK